MRRHRARVAATPEKNKENIMSNNNVKEIENEDR